MVLNYYPILFHFTASWFLCFESWPGEPIEREKQWGESGRRKHHFREMRQPSAMPADDRDSAAAQLLGNGGKIEPYTIIIMGGREISFLRNLASIRPCQPTIAAQLLGNGGKIEPSIYKFEFWLMYCLFVLYLLPNQWA
jgi:hypothetical protein